MCARLLVVFYILIKQWLYKADMTEQKALIWRSDEEQVDGTTNLYKAQSVLYPYCSSIHNCGHKYQTWIRIVILETESDILPAAERPSCNLKNPPTIWLSSKSNRSSLCQTNWRINKLNSDVSAETIPAAPVSEIAPKYQQPHFVSALK